MTTLACALENSREEAAVAALDPVEHTTIARIGSGENIVAVVLAVRPAVVIVSASPQRLTADLIQNCDDLGIRIIALSSTEAGRRNAITRGIYEVVDVEYGEAAESASRINEYIRSVIPTPPVSRTRRGKIVVVWGAHGAPGRTTVAVSIAAELSACGHRVALVDADTHAASIAPVLGLLDEAPGFAAACRLAGQKALTLRELDRVHQNYRVSDSHILVLTGITRASRWPELSADRVTATLELCREWAEYVVVDVAASLEHDEEISSDIFAPRRNGATLAALRAADTVVAVGAADPLGLSRFLRNYADLIEVVPDQQVVTVINKVRATVSGLNPAGQVKSTLARFGGIDEPVIVPHDPRATDAAAVAGRAIRDVSPRSHAHAAIRRMVATHIADPRPLSETPAAAAASTSAKAETRRTRRQVIHAPR